MAINLSKRSSTTNLILKVISVKDDAIDWDISYPEIQLETDQATIEARKAAYTDEHDISKLAWLDGKTPSVFCFKHPKRMDASDVLKDLGTGMISDKISLSQVASGVWNKLFIGIAEGLQGEPVEHLRDRKGNLPEAFFISLHEAEIRDEMAFEVMGHMKERGEDRAKK